MTDKAASLWIFFFALEFPLLNPHPLNNFQKKKKKSIDIVFTVFATFGVKQQLIFMVLSKSRFYKEVDESLTWVLQTKYFKFF